jgi:mannosyl-oligosaccharide alpha-1,2-mannosidase
MYQRALDAMKQSIFFRPLVPGYDVVLFPGSVETNGSVPLDELVIKPRVEHLGCFSGGMVAVAAKIFNNEAEMATAHKLVEGCLLAYENGPKGIMPEVMSMVACRPSEPCKWDERRWEEAVVEAHGGEGEADEIIRKEYLPEGVARVDDTKYHLR